MVRNGISYCMQDYCVAATGYSVRRLSDGRRTGEMTWLIKIQKSKILGLKLKAHSCREIRVELSTPLMLHERGRRIDNLMNT